MENCSICNSPFRQVPAGVSQRTGKPYPAFVACSKMGCPGKPGAKPAPTYVPKQEPNWDKIRDEKKDNIKWLNAINNACLLIANGKYPLTEGNIATSITGLAEQIYILEPTKVVENPNGSYEITNEAPPFN